MNATVKLLGLGLITTLLAACATPQNYQLAVNSWQGASADSLFHVWGYPNRIQKMPSGHQLYVYSYRDKGRYPVYTTPGSTTVQTGRHGRTFVQTTGPVVSGGGSYDFRCKTWFEVNQKNIIVNTSFRGNDCLATSEFLQMKANPARQVLTQN